MLEMKYFRSIRELIRGAAYSHFAHVKRERDSRNYREIGPRPDVALRKESKRHVSDCVKEFELKR